MECYSKSIRPATTRYQRTPNRKIRSRRDPQLIISGPAEAPGAKEPMALTERHVALEVEEVKFKRASPELLPLGFHIVEVLGRRKDQRMDHIASISYFVRVGSGRLSFNIARTAIREESCGRYRAQTVELVWRVIFLQSSAVRTRAPKVGSK